MIRVSAGTAHVLGLKSIQSDADPTTGYFLTGEACRGQCAFCPQGQGETGKLSRIIWPEYPVTQILAAMKEQSSLKRYCLQVADGNQWLESTVELLQTLHREGLAVPRCVSCRPRSLEDIQQLLDAGADKVSIALDACTPEVAAQVGRDWQGTWALLTEASRAFPGRISTHLIIGLGETELEASRCLQELHILGITVALFAFTPVKGTAMAEAEPPDIGRYRRLQAVHYLLRQFGAQRFGSSSCGTTAFTPAQQAAIGPAAFETSGCPDCNRPYYNERPHGTMYNYPRPLTAAEFQHCLRDMEVSAGE